MRKHALGSVILLLLVLFGAVAAPSTGLAQSRAPDLSQMSIEDLMNIEITSASRKEQRAADVAAAVFVITHDDIRRSGMTTIPDLLRLAPGVQVAQINSNKWAVSVRGFNGLYANKLLVLVDGRSVYNRLFSGVLWDARGPDARRHRSHRGDSRPRRRDVGRERRQRRDQHRHQATAETQGGLVRVEAGGRRRAGSRPLRRNASARPAIVCMRSGPAGMNRSSHPARRADDASHSVTTGFRTDWTTQPGAFTLEGAFTAGRTHALWPNLDPQTAAREPIASDRIRAHGRPSPRPLDAHARRAARRCRSSRSSTSQTATSRSGTTTATPSTSTRNTTRRSARITISSPAPATGSRGESLAGHVGFSLTPADDHSSLVTAFMQDEIALFGDRLAVTLGTQVQHDSDSGAGVQPTARVMWKVRSRASASGRPRRAPCGRRR